MGSAWEHLALEWPAEFVAVLCLNRPHRANALNTALAQELAQAFTAIGAGTDCRCLILTGAGERAFCAGADLKDRLNMDLAAWQAQHQAFQEAAAAMRACPLPVIVAVNGAAFGGGLEITLIGDFALAADTARFALTEVTLGIMPGLGGTQRLARAAGRRRAAQQILTGQVFSAAEACAWGIVNEVHPPERLLPRAIELAGAIAANAPLAVRAAKAAIRATDDLPLTEGLGRERELYRTLIETADRREGIAAFNEKRKPRFTGR
ncbi:MAG: enoyl-CoA hydratase [Gammaproteobacteria bacterium]|nr:enoyl-CoA hydratase [Gammaproteobacteria bacterium]